MRKFIPLIVLSILILLSASCRRTSHNGKIDGFWKVMEIRYDEDVVAAGTVPFESVSPESRFICINLELIQFGNPNPEITGVIAYNKGDSKLGIDFPTNPRQHALLEYGLEGTPATLDIVTLSDKHLVLKSTVATISCRRF